MMHVSPRFAPLPEGETLPRLPIQRPDPKTIRERLWRNIREATALREAPSHLSETRLRHIMAQLLPAGPVFMEDIPILECPEGPLLQTGIYAATLNPEAPK